MARAQPLQRSLFQLPDALACDAELHAHLGEGAAIPSSLLVQTEAQQQRLPFTFAETGEGGAQLHSKGLLLGGLLQRWFGLVLKAIGKPVPSLFPAWHIQAEDGMTGDEQGVNLPFSQIHPLR